MATIIFDGKTSVTASSKDTVIITANPALFQQASDNGVGGSTFSFSGGATLTLTDLTVDAAQSNVQLAAGTFATGPTGVPATSGTVNDLIINVKDGQPLAITGSDSSGVHAVFGGFGVASPSDGNDSITIGSGANTPGSFLIVGNGGADTVDQAAGSTFDSTSFISVFAGKGDDVVTLSGGTKANIFVVGGEGKDSITLTNAGTAGSTTVLGGTNPGDSADSADTISMNGGGTFTIYANGGADVVNLGDKTALDSTTVGVVFGGVGGDTVTATAFAGKGGTITIFGGENADGVPDQITVSGNAGRTVIYGGTGAGDSADSADSISFSSAFNGTTFSSATIYANAGNDSVVLAAGGGGTGSATSVFAGLGKDIITVNGATATTGTFQISGNEGADTIGIGSNTANAEVGANTGQTIQILGFEVGTDKLTINNNAVGGGPAAADRGDKSSSGSLNDALNAATTDTATQVTVVRYQTDTYVVVNNNTAGFDPNADLAVKLTGVTDSSGVASSITVV
jgi:hypothetical protein